MTQTKAVFFAALACLLAYLGGYWQGQRAADAEHLSDQMVDEVKLPLNGKERQAVAQSPPTMSGVDQLQAEFEALLANGAWFQLESWLVEHPQVISATLGQKLVPGMAQRVNKYDAVAMRRVLRAYLSVMADDTAALFLLSDLQQISGMREAALDTLFDILTIMPEADLAQQARRQADQIIFVIDNELKLRGALSEREAFWRHVSMRVPGSDRYRHEWAKALAGLQRWDAAKRVLAETGTSDIEQASIDELAVLIDNAEQGLQFQRDGDRLLSAVTTPTGVSLTLLVDTGANVTSLSKSALRLVAAQRLDEQARIRTANGVVETGVFRVTQLQVQGREFNNLRVIELPTELPGLDGLLGLDILNQLSIDPLRMY